ncbi:hypothetical protein [Paenibacillus sp. P36]|uniref:hypothetical protein n=1 Tax=Paenibacillus sp. P36 TaxID=3342538 RepID=UPI0038B3E03D
MFIGVEVKLQPSAANLQQLPADFEKRIQEGFACLTADRVDLTRAIALLLRSLPVRYRRLLSSGAG